MKDYIEWEGEKLIIEEKSMKSKKNQYNHIPIAPKSERYPYKRKDQITFELIMLCLLGAFAWGAFLYGLTKLMG
tara:strand:- start:384 stop:605 length:222 start_codon:yes stop_codon:yes gene_type:complete